METKETLEIVDYDTRYRSAFRELNVEWISHYFVMEEPDYKALDHPEEYILNKGGVILVALLNRESVGVCALIKMVDPVYDFEMAKMAVSPKAQGKKIGFALGRAILEKARNLGAKKVYLESNRILLPAIHLYYKLGFTDLTDRKSPYSRADIFMECNLT